MRLKRVRIFGFKTFADRTDFNVDGGVIAVVGPNGCGKSNLVDAILWALGENNARHLRAGNGQDVIFSGSSRRKPVGFAEVSLLFDNEDGSLPIDTSEVSVTRRLSRSGESEYQINRRSCRQRDIHELLADSGLGRAGYAIVGQKEIDQALAASPLDRRAWVDEAAGVQRYRTRKIESLRRLAGAQEHLVRVDDILRELEAQREPLRQEAEVARQYKEAASALREIETGVLILDFAHATSDVTATEERLRQLSGSARKEAERADALELQAQAELARTGEVDAEIDAARARVAEATSAIDRRESDIRLAEERLRSLAELDATLRATDAEEQRRLAQADLDSLMLEESTEAQAIETLRLDCGGASEESKALVEQVSRVETDLARAREQHGLRMRQEAERTQRHARRAMVHRELEGIVRDLPALNTAREAAAGDAEALLQAFSNSEQILRGLEAELTQLRQREDAVCTSVRGALAERAALEGRKRGIEATILAHEGLTQGSRAVLDAVDAGQLDGRYLPVGQAITVARDLALAIETALGAAANDLIVASEREAQAAIHYLKEHRLGRATFQPISLMRPSRTSPELMKLLGDPDILGIASDLVTCEQGARPVIDSLLGRMLIAKTLDAALRLAKTSGWTRLVSLEGEIVFASGAVSGGQTAKGHFGIVHRQADLMALEGDIGALSTAIAAAERELTDHENRRRDILGRISCSDAALAESRANLDEARDYLRTISAELHEAERAREKLQRESDNLEADQEVLDEVDVAPIQRERDRLVSQLAEQTADANQARESLRLAELRLVQCRDRVKAARKRVDAAALAEAQRIEKLKHIEPERNRTALEIERRRAEAEAWELRRRHAEADLATEIARRDAAQAEVLRLGVETKAARAHLAAMTDRAHQDELLRARAESRRAAAAERLLEEYGIGAEDALAQADRVDLPKDAQPLANRLRREIRAMGAVNVGAIEAYDRLAARNDELSAQRDDILEGVEQVQASMRELDRLTRDRFLDTFALVQQAYERMFQKLFGGGEGRIFLDQPDSILDSGIEIEVTLPGKRKQRLELLSGGERALCAMGFLFALLDVKPSPLVVLDEVDAPLDGRNVERFGDLLLEFTDRTQFIVITHNPTTIERAPVWLGVTMQEPGVSTLLPVRLPVAASPQVGLAAVQMADAS